MKKEKAKAIQDIDWEALDMMWADKYAEDYGYHFSNMFLSNINTHVHAANHPAKSMASSS